MKNSRKSLLFLSNAIVAFFMMFICSDLSAKHIIGGDVFYECVSIDTINNRVRLHFEFQMYRDNRCTTNGENCAYFDGDSRGGGQGAEFGVYRGSGNNWRYVTGAGPLRPENISKVPPNSPPCLIAPPAVDVERGIYQFDIELDIIDENYMIAYQRCCRSESIDNIVNPGQYGAVFSIEITPAALATCNNSPVFNEFPPLIVCAGFDLVYDHSATDMEGDQIVYEFCQPLSAGGPNVGAARTQCRQTPVPEPTVCLPQEFRNVQFKAPSFTTTTPMGGRPSVSIDRNTGLLTGVPTIVGEHVMAICAKEYRDGQLLSTIRRDFQFVVSICEKAVDAIIEADNVTDDGFEVLACGELDVKFINKSVRERDIQEYYWEFDTGESSPVIKREKDPQVTFPNLGVFDAKMIINPGIPNCTDSANLVVRVLPGLDAEFTQAYDTCVAGPVSFTDLSSVEGDNVILSRTWDYDDGIIENALNPQHLYGLPGTYEVSLVIEDNNRCRDEHIVTFTYAPAPSTIIIEPSRFLGCEPAEVFFNNLTAPIDSTYGIEWDFGDGSEGDERTDISPTHVYEEDGTYSVSIAITSPIGCVTTRSFNNWINVQKGPDADFSFTPDKPTTDENTVSFLNNTIGAIGYYWTLGDGSISFDENPTHTYQDTGKHVVVLQATSSNGCTDTISQVIDVVPVADIKFPNAFTPNGDGDNDEFRGVGDAELLVDYRLTIYDRWGGIVFSSTDPLEGWNGQRDNTGAHLPIGVYMYRADWQVPRGDRGFSEGPATLVR